MRKDVVSSSNSVTTDDDDITGACADCSCCLKVSQKGRIRSVADLFFILGGIECLYFFVIAIASCIVLQFSDVEACDKPLKEWVFTTVVVYYVFVVMYQCFFFDLFGACVRADVWYHFWFIGFHVASFAWSIVGCVWFFQNSTGESTHLYKLCYVYTILFLVAAGSAFIDAIIILVCWWQGKWLWAPMARENWDRQQEEDREADAKKKFEDQQTLLRTAEAAISEAQHTDRVQRAFEETNARDKAEQDIKEAQASLQASIRGQAERRAAETAASQRAIAEQVALADTERRNAAILQAAKEEEARKAAAAGLVLVTAAEYAAQQAAVAAKKPAAAASVAAEEDFEI